MVSLIGAGLGGLTISELGIYEALWIDTLTFLVSALIFASLPPGGLRRTRAEKVESKWPYVRLGTAGFTSRTMRQLEGRLCKSDVGCWRRCPSVLVDSDRDGSRIRVCGRGIDRYPIHGSWFRIRDWTSRRKTPDAFGQAQGRYWDGRYSSQGFTSDICSRLELGDPPPGIHLPWQQHQLGVSTTLLQERTDDEWRGRRWNGLPPLDLYDGFLALGAGLILEGGYLTLRDDCPDRHHPDWDGGDLADLRTPKRGWCSTNRSRLWMVILPPMFMWTSQ